MHHHTVSPYYISLHILPVLLVSCVLPPCRGLSQVYGLMVDARGGFSGGTIASGFNQSESESPADVSQMMADKYFLLPADAT